MSKDAECMICCRRFTKTLRIPIKCRNVECNQSYCRECLQNHLLTTEEDEPKCMNRSCNKVLTLSEILETFLSKKFIADYRNHRTECIFKREQAFIPQTMVIIQRENAIKESEDKISELKTLIRKEKHKISRLKKEEEELPQQYSVKCPNGECKGMLNAIGYCELCKETYCTECLEVKGEEHKCNEEQRLSVEAIRKESKPCPCCQEPISKISGCDQMYCTKCKSVWSWNTRTISVEGRVHNPHAIQEARNNGGQRVPRELGDVPCGGLPRRVQLEQKIHSMHVRERISHDEYLIHKNRMLTRWYFANNLRNKWLPEFYKKRTFNKFIEKRKAFMRSEITEKQFKAAIKRADILQSYYWEIYQILDTACVLYEEIFRKICDESMVLKKKQLNSYLKKFEDIQELYNKFLRRCSMIYNLTYYLCIYKASWSDTMKLKRFVV